MPWPSISDLRFCVSLSDFRKRGPTQARFCQVRDISFHKRLYAPPPILHDQLLSSAKSLTIAPMMLRASVAHTEASSTRFARVGRSDRSIVHADRRRRGGECTAAGRRAPEDLFGQAPVRLERAHHEPEPGGPVSRRRWLAADRVRRIRVRGVPRHSLDNGPPPGHHGAARLRGGRPAPGLRRHGGELVAPGRGGRSASPGFNGPTPAGRPAARPGGVGGRGRAPALRRGARSPACGRGAGRVAWRATGCRYGRGSG
jgi:hypothetical protein